jgi:hypothetical protein
MGLRGNDADASMTDAATIATDAAPRVPADLSADADAIFFAI